MVPEEVNERWAQAVRDCGRSLIDNAEEIAGRYDLQTGVDILIRLRPNEFSQIEVSSTYLPKNDQGKAFGL